MKIGTVMLSPGELYYLIERKNPLSFSYVWCGDYRNLKNVVGFNHFARYNFGKIKMVKNVNVE